MFRPIVLALAFGCAAMTTFAQSPSPIPLWSDGAPGALGTNANDIPTVTAYLPEPDKASGAAIVICPGGGYGGLAPHEGNDYALFLNQQGVAGFVLKYRLGSHGYRHPAMLQDVQRAIRLVRSRAADWKIDPKRVGVLGSSAGGHLASTAVTHFDAGIPDAVDPVDRESSRPDLGILCYPVITLGPKTHQGSKHNLLEKNPDPEFVTFLSSERQVTKETPPCFLWHTSEDTAVPVENSLEFAAALQRSGVPFDLHIYQQGRHGLGLVDKAPFKNAHPWAADLVFWLQAQKFVKKEKAE